MQDIIASLPEHVLNFKDYQGRTIIDWEFHPFAGVTYTENITDTKSVDVLIITRPHYILKTIECSGEKITVATKVEGNIQEVIDNKVNRIYIYNHRNIKSARHINSFEDDVYKLLDAGHIQFLSLRGELKSNGKQYHVDFVDAYNQVIGDNITSYYNYGMETEKTVVLRSPIGPITNNLISLGYKCTTLIPYPDPITSKFIGNTSYAWGKNQDILDMIDELKAKIEAL